MKNLFPIFGRFVQKDGTIMIMFIENSQPHKYENSKNSSIILENVKENLNDKHPKNSLTHIHNSFMKNMLSLNAFIVK